MTKFLTAMSGAALFLASGSAVAADLPSRQQEPSVPYVAPAQFTWTGAYIGLNAGAAFNNSNRATLAYTGYNEGWGMQSSRDTAFTWGGTIGFNYQMGEAVVGIESDFNFANVSNRSSLRQLESYNLTSYATLDRSVVGVQKNDIRSFGTLRARVGYLIAPQFLVYATGGLAYGNTRLNGSVEETLNINLLGRPYSQASYEYYGRRNKTEFGWALGGGAEYAIDRNWSVKGEYLYTSLPSSKLMMVSPDDTATYNTRQRNSFSLVRVGVNYRF